MVPRVAASPGGSRAGDLLKAVTAPAQVDVWHSGALEKTLKYSHARQICVISPVAKRRARQEHELRHPIFDIAGALFFLSF